MQSQESLQCLYAVLLNQVWPQCLDLSGGDFSRNAEARCKCSGWEVCHKQQEAVGEVCHDKHRLDLFLFTSTKGIVSQKKRHEIKHRTVEVTAAEGRE